MVAVNKLVFFLGGADLEMQEIRTLLEEQGLGDAIADKCLSWGAKASDYRDEIRKITDKGRTPVVIELESDLPECADPEYCIIIDHHGERAGADKPSSLRQVFDLLQLPESDWTRWRQLVSINDVGHIRGLKAFGASDAEVRQIRDADRRAQGVTPEEEELSRRALETARGNKNYLRIETDLATSSAIIDFLDPAYGGTGCENVLIEMPGKLAFYGEGNFITVLSDLPGCWYGGALPERGYWGIADPRGEFSADVLKRLRDAGLEAG